MCILRHHIKSQSPTPAVDRKPTVLRCQPTQSPLLYLAGRSFCTEKLPGSIILEATFWKGKLCTRLQTLLSCVRGAGRAGCIFPHVRSQYGAIWLRSMFCLPGGGERYRTSQQGSFHTWMQSRPSMFTTNWLDHLHL